MTRRKPDKARSQRAKGALGFGARTGRGLVHKEVNRAIVSMLRPAALPDPSPALQRRIERLIYRDWQDAYEAQRPRSR